MESHDSTSANLAVLILLVFRRGAGRVDDVNGFFQVGPPI